MFQSDFFTCTGNDIYCESVVRRSNHFFLPLLSEANVSMSSKVTSQNFLSSSGTSVVLVRWNVTFIPETVSFLNFIGEGYFYVIDLTISYYRTCTWNYTVLYIFILNKESIQAYIKIIVNLLRL